MRFRYQHLHIEMHMDRLELRFIWRGRYSTPLETETQIQAPECSQTGDVKITRVGLVLPPGVNFTHRHFRNTFSYFNRKFCLLSLQTAAPPCKSTFILSAVASSAFFTYHLKVHVNISTQITWKKK